MSNEWGGDLEETSLKKEEVGKKIKKKRKANGKGARQEIIAGVTHGDACLVRAMGAEAPEINTPKAQEPKEPVWPDLTKQGEPKRTYRNARAAIQALGVTCSYDVFHDRMLVGGNTSTRRRRQSNRDF